MKTSWNCRSRGFTLIELLTVMVLIAILATIAIPNYKAVVNKAHAARILGDVRVVQHAYSQFIADNNERTGNAAWGVVPADLVGYLPAGFEFRDEIADYRWIRLRAGLLPTEWNRQSFGSVPKPGSDPIW